MGLKTSVFIATSMDGYIAREDGSIDWLIENQNNSNEDFGYNEFIKTIDVLIMGRNTFETALSFGKWPYKNLKVIALSSNTLEIPRELKSKVSNSSLPPIELIAELENKGFTHAYVDGGKTIQSFLRENLIDEITITTIPVLLGGGLPLFGFLRRDIKLNHLSTNVYDNGFVQTKYQVIKFG